MRAACSYSRGMSPSCHEFASQSVSICIGWGKLGDLECPPLLTVLVCPDQCLLSLRISLISASLLPNSRNESTSVISQASPHVLRVVETVRRHQCVQFGVSLSSADTIHGSLCLLSSTPGAVLADPDISILENNILDTVFTFSTGWAWTTIFNPFIPRMTSKSMAIISCIAPIQSTRPNGSRNWLQAHPLQPISPIRKPRCTRKRRKAVL